jgi:ribonuclease D
MYDAGSDLSLLKNTSNIEMKSILDLRPAVTLLNYEKQDLHSIIASEFGILFEGKRKFQKHNWMIRPISPEAIEYALNDVTYLIKLKDILMKKLYERHILDIYMLKNLKIQNKNYTRDPESLYNRIRGWDKLPKAKKAVVRKMVDIIEKYAALHNTPSHNLIDKNDVIGILNNPVSLHKIQFHRRFNKDSMERLINELTAAIKMGKEAA